MKKDFKTTLESLKMRGYWSVNVHPNNVLNNVIDPINKGKEIIKSSSIQFRGWDYPHYPTATLDHQDLYLAGDKVEAWIDYEQYKEVWRLYQNGQFIHMFALREDWWELDSWLPIDNYLKKIKPGSILEVIGAIYSITEMFAFLNNFIGSTNGDEYTVEISLTGTSGRKLHISDRGRAPLFMDYSAKINEIILPKKVFTKEQLVKSYLELAYDQIVYLFHQFNWDNPPERVIREDQKKLIERRL